MPGTLLIGFRNANSNQYTVVSSANPLPVTGGGGGGGGGDATEVTLQQVEANTAGALTELQTLNSTSELPAAVVPTGRMYEPCLASATTVLGVTGGVGDDLDFVVITPSTTAPGIVQIKDGAGTAITLFAGGTIASVIPFQVPVYSRSLAGAWSIITGANVTALGVGAFQS